MPASHGVGRKPGDGRRLLHIEAEASAAHSFRRGSIIFCLLAGAAPALRAYPCLPSYVPSGLKFRSADASQPARQTQIWRWRIEHPKFYIQHSKSKRTWKVRYFRLLPGGEEHLEHIHAHGHLAAEAAEPEAGGAADELALVVVHAAGGAAAAGAHGAFHLGKDEQVALAAHKVELAAGPHAPAVAQHLVALRAQPRGRHQLAIFAQVATAGAARLRPGAAPAVQQAQTCGDGVS